jgi:hypothetical protein
MRGGAKTIGEQRMPRAARGCPGRWRFRPTLQTLARRRFTNPSSECHRSFAGPAIARLKLFAGAKTRMYRFGTPEFRAFQPKFA